MFDRNGNDNSNYNQMIVEEIKKSSEKVADLVEKEYLRQKNNVELIASENYCSEAVMAACGSCLSWKYAEGYPAAPATFLWHFLPTDGSLVGFSFAFLQRT